jgi:hypothetical protein
MTRLAAGPLIAGLSGIAYALMSDLGAGALTVAYHCGSSCSTMPEMQRILIAIGAALLLAGLLWPWLSSLGLGRLPGDIRIETQNGVFYAPITTCVVISIILLVVIWFIRR